MTVSAALRLATRRLAEAGIQSAGWDAEVLLRHLLGWDRARLIGEATTPLGEADAARFLALVAERAARRPLQHLTGTQAFWRHEFYVTPDVLVPRPETELLVETCLGLLRDVASPTLVDVGTGTGCVALSLAAERPDAEVHAVDVSAAALAVAEENARRLGLARVHFRLGDLLEPVAELTGVIDLVVSNPPYVDPAEALAPEARHDPAIALFPPGDRFSIYDRLASGTARVLRPGGWTAVEVGRGMAHRVGRAFAAAGLAKVRRLKDLRGIPRVVVGSRPEPTTGSVP